MTAKLKNEELLAYLFDDKPHTLTTRMSSWIDSSRPYKDFATTYRDKIRKKIRITQNETAIRDLAAELSTAYWLLQEKRFTTTYEPYGSEKTRGPDFAVAFKSMTFNVEVTRISAGEKEQPSDNTASPWLDSQHVSGRLMDTVCDKLGQMRPGMVNVLLIVTDSDFARLLDLNQAISQLKDRAERQDTGLFGRYGYIKTADFFKYYLRLSGVLIRTVNEQDETTHAALWTNNQTKHSLPRPLQAILQRG
jgi:hypothetical protein